MKFVMIAALVAAQLAVGAAPAQAAGPPSEEAATRPLGGEGMTAPSDLADRGGAARLAQNAEPDLGDGQELALRDGSAPASSRAAAADEDQPKKRKSTGDKVLTGAAVILGLGALAVGGLLVAIFVN
jgi:hypothetical protein